MTNPDNSFEEVRHFRRAFDLPTAASVRPRHRRAPDDAAALTAMARGERWLVPPAALTRVVLRPWPQAVFWGRRVYVAALLVVMANRPAHIAAGE